MELMGAYESIRIAVRMDSLQQARAQSLGVQEQTSQEGREGDSSRKPAFLDGSLNRLHVYEPKRVIVDIAHVEPNEFW